MQQCRAAQAADTSWRRLEAGGVRRPRASLLPQKVRCCRPIVSAIARNAHDVIAYLVARGADIDAPESFRLAQNVNIVDEKSVWHWALIHGDLDTITTIIRSLPDARRTHAAGQLRLSILADAVFDGDVQAQRGVRILQARIDANLVDLNGRDAYD